MQINFILKHKLVAKLLTCILSGIYLIPVFPVICFAEDSQQNPDSLLAEDLLFGEIKIISQYEPDNAKFEAFLEEYTQQIVTEETYNSLTNNLLSVPINDGYYFSSLSLKKVRLTKKSKGHYLNPTFILHWGEQVKIDTFFFEGLEKTSPDLLLRELKRFNRTLYSKSLLRDVKQIFNRYPFLYLQDYEEVVRRKERGYGLLLRVTERPSNEFTGVVGYIPPKGLQEGYFTGEINLKLLNISGTGRQLFIYWSRVNQYSQELNLKYFEPWILNTNFFGEIEFEQVLRDTLVVIRQFDLGIGRRITKSADIQMGITSQRTIPTPGGREMLGLYSIKSTMGKVEFNTDRRDSPLNPTMGFQLRLKGMLGSRIDEEAGNNRQYQGEFDGEFNYPIVEQLVANFQGHFKGKWLSGKKLSYSDQFWFGGANSLRGYAEDFFRGSEIGWASFELRWLIGDFNRIYLFVDQGYYRSNNDYSRSKTFFPRSFGIGLRLDSRIGIVGIDYGLGKGDTFTTAKIHIYLENRF